MPEEVPRGPEEVPRRPREPPKRPQKDPKRPQNIPQEVPKLLPRGPRETFHKIPTKTPEASDVQPRHEAHQTTSTIVASSQSFCRSADWRKPLESDCPPGVPDHAKNPREMPNASPAKRLAFH